MTSMTVADAARDFPRVVRDLSAGEPVQLTLDGRTVAVLLHPDDVESLHETFVWLQDPHVVEDVRRARLDFAQGRTIDGDLLRERYLGPTA